MIGIEDGSTVNAIIGNIDYLDVDCCAGWVMDRNYDKTPLSIQVVVDGIAMDVIIAELYRHDVAEVHGNGAHGFSFGLEHYLTNGKKNVVELRVPGSGFNFDGKKVAVDTRNIADFVESGRDGFLFLQNDSNNVRGMIQGDNPLSAQSLRNLRLMLHRRLALSQSIGAKMVNYIIPEKGVVLNHFRKQPLAVTDARPAVQLAEICDAIIYNQKLFFMQPEPERLFGRLDTHIAPDAHREVFEDILSCVGLKSKCEYHLPTPLSVAGDLGAKIGSVPEIRIVEAVKFSTKTLVDEISSIHTSGQSLRGRRVYHVSDAPNKLVCVVIGTSSAYYLLPHFYASFKYVYFYWDNIVDDDFLRTVRPHYIFCIFTERTISENIIDNTIEVAPLEAGTD